VVTPTLLDAGAVTVHAKQTVSLILGSSGAYDSSTPTPNQLFDPGQTITIDVAGHGQFHLLTGPGGDAWRTACMEIEASIGLKIQVSSIGPGQDYADPYRQWRAVCGVSDQGCVLVRPDRHVAWRAITASPTEIATLKSGILSLLGKSNP